MRAVSSIHLSVCVLLGFVACALAKSAGVIMVVADGTLSSALQAKL